MKRCFHSHNWEARSLGNPRVSLWKQENSKVDWPLRLFPSQTPEQSWTLSKEPSSTLPFKLTCREMCHPNALPNGGSPCPPRPALTLCSNQTGCTVWMPCISSCDTATTSQKGSCGAFIKVTSFQQVNAIQHSPNCLPLKKSQHIPLAPNAASSSRATEAHCGNTKVLAGKMPDCLVHS